MFTSPDNFQPRSGQKSTDGQPWEVLHLIADIFCTSLISVNVDGCLCLYKGHGQIEKSKKHKAIKK
jgi:hypothetical protein